MASDPTPCLDRNIGNDDQLRLTLAISSSYDNDPQPSCSSSPQQNQPKRDLQPFVFQVLTPTNDDSTIVTQAAPTLSLTIKNVESVQAVSEPPTPPVLTLTNESFQTAPNPPESVVESVADTDQQRQEQNQQKQSRPSSSKKKKSKTIPQPYPWSTNKRCEVFSSNILKSRGIVSITGKVKCRKCEQAYEMELELDEKFIELANYIILNGEELCHRAPDKWLNPILPACRQCGQENAVKPEVEGKKKNTNWLFLFLGQMLGCCTGDQLKYFCKHNGHHRTAAKDRLLYLAYLSICRQLDPEGPFDL